MYMHGESCEKKHWKRIAGSRASNLVDRSVGFFEYTDNGMRDTLLSPKNGSSAWGYTNWLSAVEMHGLYLEWNRKVLEG